MRATKHLVTGTVSLLLLATLSGCGSDSDPEDTSGGAFGDAFGTGGLPSAKSLEEVQEFILGAGLPCTSVTTDESGPGTPAEGLLGTTDGFMQSEEDKRKAAAWTIKERGFCGDTVSELGGWAIYLPEDMKAFQENYRDQAREAARDGGWTGKLARGKFFFGADFVVAPTNYPASSTLLQTGLMMENCDPGFKAPSGYRTQDALAEGCVLTTYLSETEG
jgi:hypothetical protein